MIRRFIPNEHCVSMPLFFGFLGLFNSILLLPLLIGLNVFGVESLSSLTWEIFGFMVRAMLRGSVVCVLLLLTRGWCSVLERLGGQRAVGFVVGTRRPAHKSHHRHHRYAKRCLRSWQSGRQCSPRTLVSGQA